MVAFIETRLPEIIGEKATGGPEFSTSIVALNSGHEQRNTNWSAPRAKYSIAYDELTDTERDTLLGFFRVMRGRASGFRFKDTSDYLAEGEAIGEGDGSETEFQLIKTYSVGANSVSRAITKPVSGTVKIYVDSVLQASGYSLDTTTGVITFSSPPADNAIISADFEFDVPVRFDMDHFSASHEKSGAAGSKDVTLLELRI